MSIDVKQAVESAQKYLTDFYPGIKGLLLEEVEFDNVAQQWLITLSFFDPDGLPTGLLGLMSRKYKIFKIDSQSGDVMAMKIRQIKND